MKITSIILLLTVVKTVVGQAEFATSAPDYERKTYNLDGRWHFIVDPFKTGEGSRFYLNRKQASISDLIEYDFSAAPTLNVPGDWNSQAENLLYYEGAVWYEHDFNVGLKPGKRYFLKFDAANYAAHVYLNGEDVGEHTGGFTPFRFEVTNLLHNGANFLVVEVDNTRKKESVPTLNYDWWNYGGITGDVAVEELPETFISDYKVQLAKGNLKAIEGYVQMDGRSPIQKIRIEIPGAALQTNIVTNAAGTAYFSVPIKTLHYWTPASPTLYDVIISAENDTIQEKIGFRTIETKGKDLLLNGTPVFLRGVCLHDENPLIPGRPRGASDIRMLLQWAKELNCNFVRLAHYPHNEYTARLADEMGLMLWEEIPVYWDIDWKNDSTFNYATEQLKDLIGRDKNRASVIIWSIGNETPTNDPREKFMEGLADIAHATDRTRLVSAALLTHDADNDTIELDDPLGSKLDVVSLNEYLGWYEDKPANINKYHFKIDYNKPVIISEFGGGALGGFHGSTETRFSEEFQEAIYENQLRLLTGIDGLRGTCPWILVDFRSPKRLNDVYQNGWNRKGLITETGNKKKAFYVVKDFYDAIQQKYPDH